MADLKLNEEILFPEPENKKDLDLYKSLQDNHKSIVDSFSALEDIEEITAGSGITDTSNTFSVTVDDTTIQIGGSGLETIDGGIDHDSLANTHNLTTDIDHDGIANFKSDEHFTEASISIPHSQISDYDTELAGKTNTTSFTPSADYHVATKKYVDDGIDAISGSLSNTVFTWSNPTYIEAPSTSYVEKLWFRYKHSDDVSTVIIEARMLIENVNTSATLQVTIGTESADVTTSSVSYVWATSDTIDVSGLTDGTTYNGKIELKGGDYVGDRYARCNAVTLIAS